MKDLLTKIKVYIPEDKVGLIEEAYKFAEAAHQGQTRLSGEPYIEHPLEVARFLADLRLDPHTLAGALLHDVMEDCGVTYDELEAKFGSEVTSLVDGVTKLSKIERMSSEEWGDRLADSEDENSQAASLRKMLVAMAEDLRVVLIKLADRLHNMRTLRYQPLEKRMAIARETLDIYAPLAHRLGIWDMKWRLEDMAFRHLNNAEYKKISNLLATKRDEREAYIAEVIGILKTELEKVGIQADITGRPKHIYSIYKKTQKYADQGKEFGEIYDLFALRCLVKEVKDCYGALGVAHNLWHPIPGQFDDYIATPKDNMYQSLHTTVLCLKANPIEIQIRTREMHRVSEYGVAAHWRYKEGAASPSNFDEKITWLRQLLEWQRDVGGAEEFLEHVKTDIFRDQVFVYTPKGEIKELPAGSTPIDFAYRIHTDLGHRCIGAKVNGKLVSLDYQLKNGDTIQILATKAARGPSLDWLNPDQGYVNTAQSREKIRQWFRRQERAVNVPRGKELLHKEFRRLDMSIDEAELAKQFKFEAADELYAALGSGSIAISRVTSRLYSQQVETQQEYQEPPLLPGPASGMEVLGVGDLATRMARCCSPIRGDDIIGYITRNRGITVHRADCRNILAEDEKERLVRVDWGRTQHLYPVRLRVEAWDRVGLLRDMTSLVSEQKVNIASVVSTEHEDSTCTISLTVHIKDVEQLSRLFSRLEGVRGVVSVARSNFYEFIEGQRSTSG